MNYRLYVEGDFAQLYAIEETCFQPPHRFSRRYMRQLVSSPDAATWIAEDQGEMAGFAIVDWSKNGDAPTANTTAYIQTIEVMPEQRVHGVGRELLRRIEDSARQAGASKIWLHVDAENQPAVNLYRSCGYLNQGEEEDYYGPGRAAMVLAKSLIPHP